MEKILVMSNKEKKIMTIKGIISRKRGKSSNHQLPKELKRKCISLSSKHFDFGPNLQKSKGE